MADEDRITVTMAEYLRNESVRFGQLLSQHNAGIGSTDQYVSELLASHANLLSLMAQLEERRVNG